MNSSCKYQKGISTILRGLILCLVLPYSIFCADKNSRSHERRFTIAEFDTISSAVININNIIMWVNADGTLQKDAIHQMPGVAFPRNSSTVVYAGGLLWGGVLKNGSAPPDIRTGGQTIRAGTVAGRITSSRLAEAAYNPAIRVYRIRKDWKTADLTRDAAESFGISVYDVTGDEIAAVRRRYKRDWLEWPVNRGAPYYERNGIPGYQADSSSANNLTKDEPGYMNADQVTWLVCNDLGSNANMSLTGSQPFGIEQQITCWAFNSIIGLENVVFERHRIIYKGTPSTTNSAHIDSMYIGKWSDVDIGDYRDDFVGCFESKNMGYAYNGRDIDFEYNKFALAPPVVGFDIMQGPRVTSPGSRAIWNGSPIEGYKNLPMTAFAAFVDSTYLLETESNNARRNLLWWNVIRGFKPGTTSPAQCYIDPFSEQCTTFPYSGDPRTYQGWVDGREYPPGDRRMIVASGPFTMALGDTQEVVIGLVAALGTDRFDGISKIEQIDDFAQDLLNRSFKTMETVPSPHLQIVELDNKLILDWETDTAKTRQVESYNSYGYKFEGYKIYQFSGQSVSSSYKLLPAFDISAPRSLHLTEDMLRERPLVNGQKYYFSVNSVVYNPDPRIAQHRVESQFQIITATPHSPNPGVVYPYAIGDTVKNIFNIKGFNDAPVTIKYFDPTKATGDTFKIAFHRNFIGTEPASWSLIHYSTGKTLVPFTLVDVKPQRVIPYGFEIRVQRNLFGYKSVYQTQYNFQPTNEPVFNMPNGAGTYMVVTSGSSSLDTLTGGTSSDKDVEFRFTGDSSWALLVRSSPVTSIWVRVPYTVWSMDRDENSRQGRQVYSAITGQGQDSIWRSTVLLDRQFNGKTIKTFYPITIPLDSIKLGTSHVGGTYYDDIPFRTGMDGVLIRAYVYIYTFTNQAPTGLWRALFADLDEDGVAVPKGTIIRFKRNKEIMEGDEKLVIPYPVKEGDRTATMSEVSKINVFPNPYYAVNRSETSRYEKFVTFNHLPYNATIRIFNLGGVLVKTIEKNDPEQFATWDVANENGLPVASGIYIAQIDLRDSDGSSLGSKMLKLMIVQEHQFLQTR